MLRYTGPRHAFNMRTMAGAAWALLLLGAGASDAVGASSASTTVNNIPSTISFTSLSTNGKVCVLGTSMQQVQPTYTVPPYVLTAGTTSYPGPLGGWAPITSTVKALQLGKDITSLTTTIAGSTQPYVNSGTLRFFYVKNPNVACSSITYSANTGTGALSATYYPYPMALMEISTYPIVNATTMVTYNSATIDLSNVDNFQLPVSMTFSGTPSPGVAVVYGVIGNPVSGANASIVNRKTLITGAEGDGTKPPFAAWLQSLKNYQSGPNLFEKLVLSSAGWNAGNPASSTTGSYPYSMLQSPTHFLGAQCLAYSNYYIPAGCGLNGQLVNFSKPLQTYFDSAVASFFSKAKGLIVMGDAQGTYPEGQWKVTSTQANCPALVVPDGQSLQFTEVGAPNATTIVCNPTGTVDFLKTPPTHYSQSADVVGQGSTATVKISAAQYQAHKYQAGWNFGQPESGWIGVVQGFTSTNQQDPNAPYLVNLVVLGPPLPNKSQVICVATAQALCPHANPSFKNWAFTNISSSTSTNPFETPTQMVFANDGAFAAWQYTTDPALLIVTGSIERNIVWAFSHGIAQCNNLTMANDSPPTTCAKLRRLAQASYVGGAYDASDAYWSVEDNWYPSGGIQNYYAQYLHTAKLNRSGQIQAAGASCSKCFNIFNVPNGSIPAGDPGLLRNPPMGMAYGFAYDENPDYLAFAPPQVPSKLDPIPGGWGGSSLNVTVIVGQ